MQFTRPKAKQEMYSSDFFFILVATLDGRILAGEAEDEGMGILLF